MSSRRRIQALEALAYRPGTESEGEVARIMLDRHRAAHPSNPLTDYLSGGDIADFIFATRGEVSRRCPCGAHHAGVCENSREHDRISEEAAKRFPRGTRVYYNCWAYEKNCTGTVCASYSNRWNWLRIKFDHLKQSRPVPVYDVDGWHISTEPLEDESLIYRLSSCYRGAK